MITGEPTPPFLLRQGYGGHGRAPLQRRGFSNAWNFFALFHVSNFLLQIFFIWLSPNKGWVGFEVAAQVAGKELSLQVREKSDFAFFVQIRMGDFVLFAFLPSGEEGFSRVVGHGDGSASGVFEVFGLDLATVDQ